MRPYPPLGAVPEPARNLSAPVSPRDGRCSADDHASARALRPTAYPLAHRYRRLQRLTQAQGWVLLALDGLQPDIGHEVLWGLRDCFAGEVLLARTLLSATQPDLAGLLRTACHPGH